MEYLITLGSMIGGGLLLGVLAGMSPGPDTVLCLQLVASRGRTSGYQCAAGIGCALLVWAALTLVVVSCLHGELPSALILVKYAGASFLVYLGLRLLTSQSHEEGLKTERPIHSQLSAFVLGLLTNILNPKAAVFFTAIVGQIVNPESGLDRAVAFLLGVVVAIPLWFATLSYFASKFSKWTGPQNRQLMDRFAGISLLGFAVAGVLYH